MSTVEPQHAAAEMLGAFVSNTRRDAIPPAVRNEAKRAILNFIGAALGGQRDASVAQLLRLVEPFSAKPEATVIGRSGRLDVLNAAFINAVAGSVLEFDDTHQPTVIHPSAPVLPVLLALADRHGGSGAALVDAFALGVDVACRVGNSVSPGHYARGWHITATCGIFGAAAAAARLLRLDAATTAHALGVAVSSASGIVENLPNSAKLVALGNSARNGLFAALAAEAGINASARSIEGKLGFARACGDEADLRELTGDLGQRWELMRNTYKPYPCGVVLAAVIDACLELRAGGIAADDVQQVVVSSNALLLARADRPVVANERDAKISLQHIVAVTLLRGAVGVAEFSQASVADPQVAALRARVEAKLDAAAVPMSATVEIITRDGRSARSTVLDARGSLENPLSNVEIESKVRGLAAFSGAGCPIDQIIESVWTIDEQADVRAFTRLLAAPGA